ncbi:hypothetical protein VMCG_07132 [Cytospora schulzeri]|uniref:Uncharacterized protein n=1 Tax=Cytospora schulzeri TaxID=448051 RepID=A0A423W4X0_9PEZI|nr:hypothetical protein VMCG_07132 [Valsa malicola]
MARRSARLASSSKPRSKTTHPASLESVTEREESPVNETTQSRDAVMSSPNRPPQTPSTASLVKPPMSEMHPSKVHPTMASPSSALRLGFTDIKPTTSTRPGAGPHQSTPSKSNTPSSPFTSQFTRARPEASLGPEARRVMDDIREEALRIKAELIAQREQERLEDDQVGARKFAQPKGKAGRYSAVHMAEFKKMDSIEHHPSAYRAAPGRFTPATAPSKGTKRSQSKANLEGTETPDVKTPAKLHSSKSSKTVKTPVQESDSPVKRTKKRAEDDASTNRPTSQDGSNIPRPKTPGKNAPGLTRAKSTLTSLMSPTQSSVARSASTKTPTATRSLLKSPSKVTLTGLKKSATVNALDDMDADKEEPLANLRTPSRFDRVKSLFAKHKATASASKPGIPRPVYGASKTPGPTRTQKELPAAPLTTPGKSFSNRVDFTPAPKHAALAQNSPSPVKSGIPRSKTTNNLVNYPALDSVMENAAAGHVSYPDLSGFRPLPEPPAKTNSDEESEDESPPSSVQPPVAAPGSFTFRSDHTIRFDSVSPNGFGAHTGQASVRQVRPSIMPPPVPDTFPSSDMPTTSAPKGKENMPPHSQEAFDIKSFPHGVGNKKRLRVEDDDEEAKREAAARAAKKQKAASVPEGEALMAPRLSSAHKGMRSSSKVLHKTPARSPSKSRVAPATTTPTNRKIATISKSRISYLATPKQRRAQTTPSRVVGRGARLACEPCYKALLDLAVCWVCGEVVFRGDECGGIAGNKGREVDEVPLCGKCADEMARDKAGDEQLVPMALGRIDIFDGGLSRRRWEAGMGRLPQRQTGSEGGHIRGARLGDRDRFAEETVGTCDGRSHGGTNLQARRFETNKTPTRPLGREELDRRRTSSPIYVSMRDPVGEPSFRPSKTKPIPKWMQQLPGQKQSANDCGDRPSSIIDDYFSPSEQCSTDSDTQPGARNPSPPSLPPRPPPVPPHTVPMRPVVPAAHEYHPTPPGGPNTSTRNMLPSRPDPDPTPAETTRQGPSFSPFQMSRPFTLIAEEPAQRPSSKLGEGRLPPSRHVRFISPPQASSCSSTASGHNRSGRPSESSEFLERYSSRHDHRVGGDGMDEPVEDVKGSGPVMSFQEQLKRVFGFY